MLRTLIFCTLVFCHLNSEAQTIKFICYLKSNCYQGYLILDNYKLKKGNYIYHSLNSGDTATLIDTGYYVLTSPLITDDSITINVKYGLNMDTVKKRDITEVISMGEKRKKGYGAWRCCDKICNGYKTEYYSNGQIKESGFYRKGKPIRKHFLYNTNGQVESIIFYNRKGKILRKEKP